MTVEITESAGALDVAADGSMLVQIISEGEGSSGKYPGETLQLAESDNVFRKGLHVYMDHPTATEAVERPERSVMDLSGTLTSDAAWNPNSRALEARYKPYPSLADAVKERAGDIGLSIRAMAERDDEGTITRIVSAESVDLVTKAGRGGKVLEVGESAGGSVLELLESTRRDIAERNGLEYQPRPSAYFPKPDPTTPEPDSNVQESTATAEENPMVEIQESELTQLRETAGRVDQLTTDRDAEATRADKAEAALAEAERRTEADSIVAEAFEGIDAPKAKARLVEAAVAADGFDAEAFKTEAEEAASEFAPTGPTVTGFGDTKPVNEATVVSDDDITTALKGAH